MPCSVTRDDACPNASNFPNLFSCVTLDVFRGPATARPRGEKPPHRLSTPKVFHAADAAMLDAGSSPA